MTPVGQVCYLMRLEADGTWSQVPGTYHTQGEAVRQVGKCLKYGKVKLVIEYRGVKQYELYEVKDANDRTSNGSA